MAMISPHVPVPALTTATAAFGLNVIDTVSPYLSFGSLVLFFVIGLYTLWNLIKAGPKPTLEGTKAERR